MAQLYRSRIRPSISAIAAVFCGAGSAAILLGLLWRHLGVLGEIVFVSAIVRALLTGYWLAWISQRTYFAWPITIALVASTAVAGSVLVTQFEGYRAWRNDAITQRDQVLDVSADPTGLQAHYRDKLAYFTFSNYLRRSVGINGPGHNADTLRLETQGGVGFALFELLLAMCVSAYTAAQNARAPVCQRCGRWLDEQSMPSAAHGNTAKFINAMLQSNTNRAVRFLVKPDTKELVMMSLATCAIHNSQTSVLRVREQTFTTTDRQLRTRHYADLQLDDSERSILATHAENLT